jgi:5-methylcytosine-specific restriction protein B
MSTAALSPARIQELYREYRDDNTYKTWRENYQAALEQIERYDDENLATPAVQEVLWSLKGMATLGVGEHLDVQGAWTDPEIVALIVQLRAIGREPDDMTRAHRLQEAFNKIIDLVSARYSKRRPWTKQARLFAALLPRHCHSALGQKPRLIVSRLLRGARGDGGIYAHALDRARLREVLGPEAGLEEDARRATFCWWLYDNEETISKGEAPVAAPPVELAPIQSPPLQLLPGPRLRRGFVAFKGYAETVRRIVEAAQGGATPDDIVETLRSTPGYEAMAPTHARTVFNLVRSLGMLEHRGGLWYPSQQGERLLDDPRQDPLTEKMLTEIFGLAHYLRLLASEEMTRKDSNVRLRQIYPAWTTDRAPSSIAAWARSLGLVKICDDHRAVLTEYGEEWETRLPKDLPVPPLLGTSGDLEIDDEDVDDDDPITDPTETSKPPPKLADLADSIATNSS